MEAHKTQQRSRADSRKHAMEKFVTPAQLQEQTGSVLGRSEWLLLDQQRIDAFADVTEDHQYIHVDVERAAKTPFGGTIAHGLLTLSLIVHLCRDHIPQLAGTQMLLNYGFDKVRFLAPVRAGSRIRAVTRLAESIERRPGQILVKLDVSVEIEGERKPALAAEWLSLHLIDGAEAGEGSI
jgi:acyl dehydratase